MKRGGRFVFGRLYSSYVVGKYNDMIIIGKYIVNSTNNMINNSSLSIIVSYCSMCFVNSARMIPAMLPTSIDKNIVVDDLIYCLHEVLHILVLMLRHVCI